MSTRKFVIAAAKNIAGQGSDRGAIPRTPWYMLPDPKSALCPECGIPCHSDGTVMGIGCKVQYRKCPKCGQRVQTRIR